MVVEEREAFHDPRVEAAAHMAHHFADDVTPIA
jgi:hypothetical protein